MARGWEWGLEGGRGEDPCHDDTVGTFRWIPEATQVLKLLGVACMHARTCRDKCTFVWGKKYNKLSELYKVSFRVCFLPWLCKMVAMGRLGEGSSGSPCTLYFAISCV